MSDVASFTAFADAARVPVWTRPAPRGFNPQEGSPSRFAAWGGQDEAAATVHAPASNDLGGPEALIAQGFAQGLEEGRRIALEELAEERAALARLAGGMESLNPAASDGLAALLRDTVKRLVTQIVGEVEIEADTLATRARDIAAMVAEEAAPARLRLHPTDVARLAEATIGVELVGDPLLAPGTIVLDTGTGWIEDGPHVRLERLRTALDRLGMPA